MFLFVVGCNSVCKGGDPDCVCRSAEVCDLSFPGGDCSMTATGQGKVTTTCAGGNCTVACNGQGDCIVTDCPDCTCTEGALTATCDVQ